MRPYASPTDGCASQSLREHEPFLPPSASDRSGRRRAAGPRRSPAGGTRLRWATREDSIGCGAGDATVGRTWSRVVDTPKAIGEARSMPEVIELRVHGVGGSPAEGLLGVATAADCIQVASLDGVTSFQARRDDLHVQGYIWGKLTAKPLLQPLWLLLLPFTLLNVGWMHRPVEELRGRSLLWLANTVLNRLYHGQTYLRFAFGPRTRLMIGAVILLLIVGLIWILTRS